MFAFSPKLYIWLFTFSELKVRKHFQIELHGCNQYSGDRWRARTRPVREQRDLRRCPRGQARDSHKGRGVRGASDARLKRSPWPPPRHTSSAVCEWNAIGVMSLGRSQARCFISVRVRRCSSFTGLGPDRSSDVTPHGFAMIWISSETRRRSKRISWSRVDPWVQTEAAAVSLAELESRLRAINQPHWQFGSVYFSLIIDLSPPLCTHAGSCRSSWKLGGLVPHWW